MFSSILVFYPPNAHRTHPPRPLVVKTRNVSGDCQMLSAGQNRPPLRTDVSALLVATHPFLYLTLHICPSRASWGSEFQVPYFSWTLSNKETPVSWFRKPTFLVWGGRVPSLLPPEPRVRNSPTRSAKQQPKQHPENQFSIPSYEKRISQVFREVKTEAGSNAQTYTFCFSAGLGNHHNCHCKETTTSSPIIKASIRQMSAVILGSVFSKFYLELIPRGKKKKKTLMSVYTGRINWLCSLYS